MNLLPFFYMWLLHKLRAELHKPEMVKKIGTLYDGLRIETLPVHDNEDVFEKVWLFPAVFMIRRSLFIVIHIVLFDHPYFQMPAHQFLSFFYVHYLCHGHLFENKMRLWVEVSSEFICIVACVFLQQFLLQPDVRNEETIQSCFILTIIFLIIINGAFLVSNIIRKKRDKKHDKGLERLKAYLEKEKKP